MISIDIRIFWTNIAFCCHIRHHNRSIIRSVAVNSSIFQNEFEHVYVMWKWKHSQFVVSCVLWYEKVSPSVMHSKPKKYTSSDYEVDHRYKQSIITELSRKYVIHFSEIICEICIINTYILQWTSFLIAQQTTRFTKQAKNTSQTIKWIDRSTTVMSAHSYVVFIF